MLARVRRSWTSFPKAGSLAGPHFSALLAAHQQYTRQCLQWQDPFQCANRKEYCSGHPSAARLCTLSVEGVAHEHGRELQLSVVCIV